MDCSTPGSSVLPYCNLMDCSTPGSSVLPCRPLSWWFYLTTSSSARPFSFCWVFPSISVLSSRLFTLGDQSIGASATILPMNIQGWFPLGLTGWKSLQPKGLSRVFSSTTVVYHTVPNIENRSGHLSNKGLNETNPTTCYYQHHDFLV